MYICVLSKLSTDQQTILEISCCNKEKSRTEQGIRAQIDEAAKAKCRTNVWKNYNNYNVVSNEKGITRDQLWINNSNNNKKIKYIYIWIYMYITHIYVGYKPYICIYANVCSYVIFWVCRLQIAGKIVWASRRAATQTDAGKSGRLQIEMAKNKSDTDQQCHGAAEKNWKEEMKK